MSKRARSPVLGYNHNLRYGGRVFHVQTEDSGTSYARLYTHLFFEGTILSSKKQEYDPEVPEDTVRALMQKLHKTMIKELMRGEHSARIGAFFVARGEPAFLEPPSVPPPVAAAEPPVVVVAPPVAAAAASGTPGPTVAAKVAPKPVVMVQPTALKRSPVMVSNPADGVVVRRNVVIDVGAGQPPVQGPAAVAAAAVPAAIASAAAARPKAGVHIAVREGGTFVAGNRARAASATEAQPHQPLASAREIRMPWETPPPRRVAQPAAAVASAPVAEAPRSTNGKIRMPWDPPGGTTEAVVSDKSLDEVILEYLADDSE